MAGLRGLLPKAIILQLSNRVQERVGTVLELDYVPKLRCCDG